MENYGFCKKVDEVGLKSLRKSIEKDINSVFNTTPEVTIMGLINIFKENGVCCYIVGGAVRDWLCEKDARDIDICVDCNVDTIEKIIKKNFTGSIQYQLIKEFGLVYLEGDIARIDINIMRNSADIKKGFFDSVFKGGASIQEDAKIRDFSINTFYYDPFSEKIINPFKGCYNDLINNRVRIIGDPKKIAVDFLLGIRIVQFISRGYSVTSDELVFLSERLENDILKYEEFGYWLNHFKPNDYDQYEIYRRILFQFVKKYAAVKIAENFLCKSDARTL